MYDRTLVATLQEVKAEVVRLAPPAFWESLQTLGANPPKARRSKYGEFGKGYTEPPIPIGGQKEYQLHVARKI